MASDLSLIPRPGESAQDVIARVIKAAKEGDEGHKYTVTMSNGDEAECDTMASMLACAGQLYADSGYESHPDSVRVHGIRSAWATVAARIHCLEIVPRTLESDLEEDR